jgi:hypothetical protein
VDQDHALPAYQRGFPEDAERKGPNGGNILCPSHIGNVSLTDHVYSLFSFSAIVWLELMEITLKNEDRRRTKTESKANSFRTLASSFFFWAVSI